MKEVELTGSDITSEAQYKAALATLGKRNRPPKLLRLLMQALEAYRGKRRMGWSRPHNKYGVKTFCTFKLDPNGLELAPRALGLARRVESLPPSRSEFLTQLVGDESLMGFIFFQDYNETDSSGATQRYETVTLSFGRVVPGQSRFRDRLDILFDAPVRNGRVQGLSRLRIVVDPFVEHSPSTFELSVDASTKELHEQLVEYYRKNRDNPARQWSHWTQDYIDYFGPREHPLQGTRFPTPIDDAHARLVRLQSANTTLTGAA